MKVYWYATTSYVLSFSPLLSLLNVCQKKGKEKETAFLSPSNFCRTSPEMPERAGMEQMGGNVAEDRRRIDICPRGK